MKAPELSATSKGWRTKYWFCLVYYCLLHMVLFFIPSELIFTLCWVFFHFRLKWNSYLMCSTLKVEHYTTFWCICLNKIYTINCADLHNFSCYVARILSNAIEWIQMCQWETSIISVKDIWLVISLLHKMRLFSMCIL